MNIIYRYLLILLIICFPAYSRADFYIVVKSDNPQSQLTKKQAISLYMGRSRSFSNGDFASVFDLTHDDPKRAHFYRELTGWNLSQVNSYWSRLMFSGQNMPPKPLSDEKSMIKMLKQNPGAIGWLSSAPSDPSLRTILVLEE